MTTPEETAERSLEILADPELGRRLGKAGKEHARRRFLTPRLLRDWLRLFSDAGGVGPISCPDACGRR